MDSVPDENFMQFGYTNPNDTEGTIPAVFSAEGSPLCAIQNARSSQSKDTEPTMNLPAASFGSPPGCSRWNRDTNNCVELFPARM